MVEALLGVQILAVAFGLFMAYLAFVHYKQQNIGRRELLFWLAVWFSMIYFSLFPKVLDPLLAKLFVTRAMDLIMITGFIILAYLGFQNHIGIKSLQRQIESLVRQKTLKNAPKK